MGIEEMMERQERHQAIAHKIRTQCDRLNEALVEAQHGGLRVSLDVVPIESDTGGNSREVVVPVIEAVFRY